ncbi:MAG: glycoside-pentoside-hexuronide (GPH):cation symporter [Eubacteriales bacterium]|nr:glycoside-pentoside-hexuronide (GPH):cation symporter [Eubacteriales bacterium]
MRKRNKHALRLDRDGIQKVMRTRDYFADSLGMFALNAISGLVGQLTYFYTDKVGVAAGAVGTMFLICKIVDAFTDIIMGNIVDNTKPGKEKYRPWLIKAGIPAGILLALMFTVPSAGQGVQIAYAMVTNILLTAVLYTAICIPYNSLIIVRTNSQEERGFMGTWRAAAGYLSGMVIAIGTIPITNMLGGTQNAYIKFGVIFGALIILCMLICYKFSRETADAAGMESAAVQDEDENMTMKEALGYLVKNKYWIIILVVNFMAQVSYGLSNSSGTYYAKWIYGNDNLVAILGAAGLIPTILGFALIAPMVKNLGTVKTLKMSFAMGMIACAIRLVNPYDFMLNTIMGCIVTFANIPMMCLSGVLMAMTVDYNEYKFGKKMVGRSGSAISFGCKVGSGIGAAMVSWCLAAANYSSEVETARVAAGEAVSLATRQAIFAFSIYVPLILFVVMFVMTCRFDLEKKIGEIRGELNRRNAAKQKA